MGADSPKRKCCGWKCIILVIALAAGGGVLVWQLLPEDSKEAAKNLFNNTPDAGDIFTPSAPDPTYIFNQCADPTSNCCNGLSSICDLPVNDIMFATAHNAMSSTENKFLFANHKYELEDALIAGYRGINVDIGKCNGSYVSTTHPEPNRRDASLSSLLLTSSLLSLCFLPDLCRN
jgi:hypothetical protein